MENDPKNHNMSWWIISLAMSVICCAVLFLVFASYRIDVDKTSAILNVRLDMMEQRLNRFETGLDNLSHKSGLSADATTPSPVSATTSSSSSTPAAATTSSAPVLVQPSTDSVSPTPPAASKTAVPEVPAGK